MPVYSHDEKKRPYELIKTLIHNEKRKLITVHKYNEVMVKRDSEGLPLRRKLDKYFQKKIEKDIELNGSKRREWRVWDSKNTSKELVKRQLSGTRRKGEL